MNEKVRSFHQHDLGDLSKGCVRSALHHFHDVVLQKVSQRSGEGVLRHLNANWLPVVCLAFLSFRKKYITTDPCALFSGK